MTPPPGSEIPSATMNSPRSTGNCSVTGDSVAICPPQKCMPVGGDSGAGVWVGAGGTAVALGARGANVDIGSIVGVALGMVVAAAAAVAECDGVDSRVCV